MSGIIASQAPRWTPIITNLSLDSGSSPQDIDFDIYDYSELYIQYVVQNIASNNDANIDWLFRHSGGSIPTYDTHYNQGTGTAYSAQTSQAMIAKTGAGGFTTATENHYARGYLHLMRDKFNSNIFNCEYMSKHWFAAVATSFRIFHGYGSVIRSSDNVVGLRLTKNVVADYGSNSAISIFYNNDNSLL